ncbi:MAG: hypothetical protein H3C31_11650 [Brumimicrobium sp.]|nr:hypothetical protein [Brumimicrobium sp.]
MIKLKNTELPFDYTEISNQLTFILEHRKGNSHKVILDTRGSLALPTDETIEHFLFHKWVTKLGR